MRLKKLLENWTVYGKGRRNIGCRDQGLNDWRMVIKKNHQTTIQKRRKNQICSLKEEGCNTQISVVS